MSDHVKATALVALGAAGVKTLIEATIIPKGAKRIKGVASTWMGGGVMTTVEGVTGLLELESTDFPESIMPMQLPLDCAEVVSSGGVAFSPRFLPVSIPCQGQETINSYITVDNTKTGTLKGRVFYWYE